MHLFFTLAVVLLLLHPARAHADFSALLEARKFAELDAAASARLQTQATDAAACLALAQAVAGLDLSARRNAVVPVLERCAAGNPPSADAHYALALTLGDQLLDKGGLAALGLAPRVKAALTTALEIDPKHYPARHLLVLFYAAAPAVVGGGIGRAAAVAREQEAAQPEHARVLRAQVALAQSRWSDAQTELSNCKPGSDKDLAADLRTAWIALAYHFTKDGDAARGKALFERLVREQPNDAEAQYGLGRALHELGDFDGAIAAYQRAAKAVGAYRQPTDYRIGMAYQAKGDAPLARAAFERYLTVKPNRHLRKSTFEDSRRRLAEL
jgi:tetratricopeptide (TPR) repeat protein